jgi:hypothetical protein
MRPQFSNLDLAIGIGNVLIMCFLRENKLWGKACRFCSERFSWAKDKADELLLPVLKEYDRREVSCVSAMFLLSTNRPLGLWPKSVWLPHVKSNCPFGAPVSRATLQGQQLDFILRDDKHNLIYKQHY